MSRGAGKIERAIEAAFASEPENAFTVEDLCVRTYRGLNRVEKKHRVAVLRAMRSLAKRSGTRFGFCQSEALGGALVIFDRLNVMSYAVGRLKAAQRYGTGDRRVLPHWRPDESKIRNMLGPGGKWHECVKPGGSWWEHVQAFRAEHDGDHATAAAYWEINAQELRRLGFGR